MAGVSIKNFTRHPVPRLPFAAALAATLPGWDISLVFAGEERAAALNRKLRRKTYVPNVLSYEVGPKSGEIIICPAVVERQASSYSLSPEAFCLLLFIHGLLHLKGWVHGVTMEARERALMARFARSSARYLNVTTHRNRNRHRHVPGKAGRRRGTQR